MAVLLYYPLVNPPSEIGHQALLYWDGISSVVPRDSDEFRTAASAELLELRDRELYSPLVFDQTAVHLRDDDNWVVLERELLRLASRPSPPRPADPPEHFIYWSKLTAGLYDQLVDLGLGERDEDSPGIAVSEEVQHVVIGTIVRHLALSPSDGSARDRRSYFPYTDKEGAHRLALEPVRQARALSWETELGRLLPLPAPGTATADVLAFRERYADERVRLMRAVHRLLGDLRRDYEHPADVFAQLRHELDEAVEDFRGAAKGVRMAWVHRSVTVAIALGAAAVGALLVPDVGWVLGAVGGYALNVATREIRPVADAAERHDFSYLHRVRTQLA